MSQGPPPVPRAQRRPDPTLRTIKILVGVAVLGFLGIMAAGFLYGLTGGPDTEVLRARDAPADMIAAVEAHFPLEQGEQVEFLFDLDLLPFASFGEAMTNRRVLSWSDSTEGAELEELRFEDVVLARTHTSSGWFGFESITLVTRHGADTFLMLSDDEERNREVIERVFELLPEDARLD